MSKDSKLSANLDNDPGYDEERLRQPFEDYEDRSRISYATNLNAGLKEKLKTISAKKDGVSMADLVNTAVKDLIESIEEEDGEYEVPDVFKVQDA
jgi:hypothetical protein